MLEIIISFELSYLSTKIYKLFVVELKKASK